MNEALRILLVRLDELLVDLRYENEDGRSRSRDLSVAITNVETGQLWLERALTSREG